MKYLSLAFLIGLVVQISACQKTDNSFAGRWSGKYSQDDLSQTRGRIDLNLNPDGKCYLHVSDYKYSPLFEPREETREARLNGAWSRSAQGVKIRVKNSWWTSVLKVKNSYSLPVITDGKERLYTFKKRPDGRLQIDQEVVESCSERPDEDLVWLDPRREVIRIPAPTLLEKQE